MKIPKEEVQQGKSFLERDRDTRPIKECSFILDRKEDEGEVTGVGKSNRNKSKRAE